IRDLWQAGGRGNTLVITLQRLLDLHRRHHALRENLVRFGEAMRDALLVAIFQEHRILAATPHAPACCRRLRRAPTLALRSCLKRAARTHRAIARSAAVPGSLRIFRAAKQSGPFPTSARREWWVQAMPTVVKLEGNGSWPRYEAVRSRRRVAHW